MFYLEILPLRERYFDLLTAVSKDGTEAQESIFKRKPGFIFSGHWNNSPA